MLQSYLFYDAYKLSVVPRDRKVVHDHLRDFLSIAV